MKHWKLVVAVSVVMVGLVVVMGVPLTGRGSLEGTEAGVHYEGTIMKPDKETLREWIQAYYSAPQTYLVPEIRQWIEQYPRLSFSLLDRLEYVPSERNQGNCENCWVWAGTGILGIALEAEEGIEDRLSIQYLTSCWSGTEWACCGGWLDWLADWYQTTGYAIPWSNANAHWQDARQECEGGTSVPCGTISTSPNYPIINCVDTRIVTHGVGRDQAVANIKNVLHQNKAVWFAYFLPTREDWLEFGNFWSYQPESAIWNPDFSCGHTWISSEAGGHAVLCVGYNDTDPDNSYWIILNSWGTTNGRPNGLFHLDMNMNYDCYYEMDGVYYYSFLWQTLDVDYGIVVTAPILEVDPSSLDFGELGKGSSQTMTFRAYNAGGGTLSGTLSANRNWITVSPTSFEGNDNTIYITVETTELRESLTPYTGMVTAVSNGGTKTVEILVTVIPVGVVAYPNPFSLTRHTNLAFWGTSVPYARIQIFTTAGELVRTLVETAGVSKLSWDGRNEEGGYVARGINVYIVKDLRGKIAVLR